MAYHARPTTCCYCRRPTQYPSMATSQGQSICHSCVAHLPASGRGGISHVAPVHPAPSSSSSPPPHFHPSDLRVSSYSSLADAFPVNPHSPVLQASANQTRYRPNSDPHYQQTPSGAAHKKEPAEINLVAIKPSSPPSTKQCSHCMTTSTPLWRREPQTLRLLCNACGLYLQQHGRLRPQSLIDADLGCEEDESDLDPNYSGPECAHCKTRTTTVWRRNKENGAQLCNACGVYLRTKGCDRPLSLKKPKIRPRKPSHREAEELR